MTKNGRRRGEEKREFGSPPKQRSSRTKRDGQEKRDKWDKKSVEKSVEEIQWSKVVEAAGGDCEYLC